MFLRQKIQDTILRKKSRAVSSKQGPMSDTSSLPSPTAASLFTSPRLFVGFSPNGASHPEAVASPTSILENKPFSAIRNPFFFERNPTKASEGRHLPRENGDPRAIGLGLLDALTNEDSVKSSISKPEKRMVVFGSQLKIQIPLPPTQSSSMGLYSSAGRSPIGTGHLDSDTPDSSTRVITRCLPPSEMELSEDYTCVILHGPNPRTTHIFDTGIVESCSNGFVSSMSENRSSNDWSGYAADGFLSFCYGCKNKIGPGEDIYMYRGEKAFCSHECLHRDMLLDEGKEKC